MNKGRRGCLKTVRNIIIIIMVMFGCSIVSTISLDVLCYDALTERLPIYPGSERTFEEHSFLRAFGMGETIIILDSDDPPEEVREWYGRASGRVSRENKGNRFFFGFSQAAWSVTDAEDGTGSQIFLSGVCAAG
jgi:hypothetical protein